MGAVAMTVAGSDPSGGAGLQADLKTFHQHGVYGMSVVTLLTVQNTQSVDAVELVEPEFAIQQFNSLINDIPPAAIKTGALGAAAMIEAVSGCLSDINCPVIVDPVMVSKHGHTLIQAEAIEKLKSHLIPKTFLLTPNLFEASVLTGMDISSRPAFSDAAKAILDMGAKAVIIKAGAHREFGFDLLVSDEREEKFLVDYIDTQNTHGSGCVFSAAITANIAKGLGVGDAVSNARAFIDLAIRSNPKIGKGRGPVNHFAQVN